MIRKLIRLPVETQIVLQHLACLGNIADLTTLSTVLESSPEQVQSALMGSVASRVHCASRGLLSVCPRSCPGSSLFTNTEKLRAETHLRIGRLLAARTPAGRREEMIFDIVNQLDRGAWLITSREERDQIAELNLIAGKRAKVSAAYALALKYFVAGSELLIDDPWERQRELSFGRLSISIYANRYSRLQRQRSCASGRRTLAILRGIRRTSRWVA